MDTIKTAEAPGGTEPHQLGEAEIIRLTDETAKSLLDRQELKTETEIWVRRGRVIRTYVRKLQPDGKFKKPDPYNLLANHPDIRWSANQLRAFVDAVELWEQLGENQPSLPMTFYEIVASSQLSFENKKELLAKALKQHLSTRDVKGELAEARGEDEADAADQEGQERESTAGSPATRIPGDWKKVETYAEKLNSELSAVDLSGMLNLEVISKLKELAEQIQDLLTRFSTGRPL